MPRHPRIALTSRLRIHTINDKFGTRVVEVPGACIKRPSQPPRKASHSTQLDNHCCDGTRFSLSAGEPPDREKPMPPRHRFLEPIHNVKERGEPLRSARANPREDLVFIPGEIGAARRSRDASWWSQPGSNRRPQACKASALPTELWPRRPTNGPNVPTRHGRQRTVARQPASQWWAE